MGSSVFTKVRQKNQSQGYGFQKVNPLQPLRKMDFWFAKTDARSSVQPAQSAVSHRPDSDITLSVYSHQNGYSLGTTLANISSQKHRQATRLPWEMLPRSNPRSSTQEVRKCRL